jgi:glyoxylase-like metal-dependent hydrolase (beta-lactamase superfamily II)
VVREILVRIESFALGSFLVNSYILVCEETGRAAVVDPGEEPQILLRRLAELGSVPEVILNTHGHIDHVAGNAALREATGAPIFMHPDDRFLLDSFEQQAAMFGLTAAAPPPPDGELVAGGEVSFGSVTLEIVHAPGHSPGSVLLVAHKRVLVGDVLFAGSVGRTDLPGGDTAALMRSIRENLLSLEDAVEVFPGHGPATTIGMERRSNPFLVPGFTEGLLGGAD